MNAKKIGTVVLLTFVAVSVGYLIITEIQKSATDGGTASAHETTHAPPSTKTSGALPDANTSEVAEPSHKVIAYYFHNTQRCMTCNKIERLSEETVREQFAEALKQGDLEWRVINMEEPPNTHFVDEYRLVASSLVLVDFHDGVQRDWTNMAKVWQYVHDEEAEFKRYVAEQTRAYLETRP